MCRRPDLAGLHRLPHHPRQDGGVAHVLHVQPRPPHGADEPAVDLLVDEERPAHRRHALDGSLQRRVPAGVRQEAPHGAVPQHVPLRRPPHDARLAVSRRRRRDGFLEVGVLQPRRDHVRPEHPEERVAGGDEPGQELRELLRRDDGEAPQADVHDGPVRLAVQPRHAAVVLPPLAGQGGGRRRGHDVERSDGEDVAHVARDVVERGALHGRRRVQHERPRVPAARREIDHLLQQRGVLKLGAVAALAWKIPPAQEALHARDAAHRLVEVATGREGELAELEQPGHGQVGEEAARARRAEAERRDAELLGDINRERQEAIGDDAGHRREAAAIAITTSQLREQGAVRAGLCLHGLHEPHGCACVAWVAVGEAVGDGRVTEPRRGGGQRVVVVVAGGGEGVVAVEEGDVEACSEEAGGEVEHAVDVALHRPREDEHVRGRHVRRPYERQQLASSNIYESI